MLTSLKPAADAIVVASNSAAMATAAQFSFIVAAPPRNESAKPNQTGPKAVSAPLQGPAHLKRW